MDRDKKQFHQFDGMWWFHIETQDLWICDSCGLDQMDVPSIPIIGSLDLVY